MRVVSGLWLESIIGGFGRAGDRTLRRVDSPIHGHKQRIRIRSTNASHRQKVVRNMAEQQKVEAPPHRKAESMPIRFSLENHCLGEITSLIHTGRSGQECGLSGLRAKRFVLRFVAKICSLSRPNKSRSLSVPAPSLSHTVEAQSNSESFADL
jgi:hypothetical protein